MSDNEVENPQPKKKRPPPPRKQPGMLSGPTKEAVKLAANYDIPPDEAYQAVTGRKPHPKTLERMNKAVERWSLRHPSALKSASKTIQKFAAGKDVNGVKPKDSTVLAAAQRIVDQVDPVTKQTLNLNLNADVSPVDLSKFLLR